MRSYLKLTKIYEVPSPEPMDRTTLENQQQMSRDELATRADEIRDEYQGQSGLPCFKTMGQLKRIVVLLCIPAARLRPSNK